VASAHARLWQVAGLCRARFEVKVAPARRSASAIRQAHPGFRDQ